MVKPYQHRLSLNVHCKHPRRTTGNCVSKFCHAGKYKQRVWLLLLFKLSCDLWYSDTGQSIGLAIILSDLYLFLMTNFPWQLRPLLFLVS